MNPIMIRFPGSSKAFLGILAVTILLLSAACGSRRSEDAASSVQSRNATSTSPESGGPLRPEESRVLGVFPDPTLKFATALLAPDSVKAGEQFAITITTTGSGCERVGDEGVLLGERDATVMVYDFTSANRPDIECTMELKAFEHTVPLTFRAPGQGVIRVWGRRQASTSPPYGEPEVIEHRILVW